MIVGCYTLDLYCDGKGCLTNHPFGIGPESRYIPVQFTGETGQECRKEATRAGWVINNRAGTCLCPKCVREGNPIDLKSNEPSV